MAIRYTQLSHFFRNCIALSLILYSFAQRVDAQSGPRVTVSPENLKAPESVVLTLRTGVQIDGKIKRFTDQMIVLGHRRAGRIIDASNTLDRVTSISIGEYNYIRQPSGLFHSERAAEWHRRGAVTVENTTSKDVVFTITAIKNPDAIINELAEGPSAAFRLFIGRASREAVAWKLRPGERTRLSCDGQDVTTSFIRYSLKTSDGTTRLEATNTNGRSGFAVAINDQHVHSPLLVEITEWKVDQDTWYTTQETNDPYKVTSRDDWFDKRTKYVTVTGGPRKYTVEDRAGTATASAVLTNTTRRRIKVQIVADVLFADFGSARRIETSLRLGPSEEKRVAISIDTAGLFGNRKATGIDVIDVTTIPE